MTLSDNSQTSHSLFKDPVHISVAIAEWLASLSDNKTSNDNKIDNPTP